MTFIPKEKRDLMAQADQGTNTNSYTTPQAKAKGLNLPLAVDGLQMIYTGAGSWIRMFIYDPSTRTLTTITRKGPAYTHGNVPHGTFAKMNKLIVGQGQSVGTTYNRLIKAKEKTLYRLVSRQV